MAGETWDEVRYHVLGQIPMINQRIDAMDAKVTERFEKLDTKVDEINTKLEKNLAIIMTKMGSIVTIGTSVITLGVNGLAKLAGF